MKPARYRIEPDLILEKVISGEDAVSTLILTVFNQHLIIKDVLTALVASTHLPSDLIIIEDGSEDETLSSLTATINGIDWDTLPFSSIRIFRNSVSKFETVCDDFGIRTATTNCVILIQSDVLITEYGFDELLLSALTSFDDLLMISGRGTELITPEANAFKHSTGSIITGRTFQIASRIARGDRIGRCLCRFFSALLAAVSVFELKLYSLLRLQLSKSSIPTNNVFSKTRPNARDFSNTGSAGYLRSHIYTEKSNFINRGSIWVSQTVMRGPVCVDRQKYLECDGFDTNSCFLGFDDHELALRSYSDRQYRVGFVPIGYHSDPNWGTTRKPRSFHQTKIAIYETLRVSKRRETTELFRLNDSQSKLLPQPEIRKFMRNQ
jgi:hypothetical protein